MKNTVISIYVPNLQSYYSGYPMKSTHTNTHIRIKECKEKCRNLLHSMMVCILKYIQVQGDSHK